RFPSMPGLSMRLGIVALALLLTLIALCVCKPPARRYLIVLWAIVAGLLFTMARVDQRLEDILTSDNENKVSRVVLRVAGLPRLAPDSRQFEAEVISSMPEGVPSRIRVTWAAAAWAGPYGGAARETAEFP